MLKLNRLLYSTVSDDSFLDEILPTDKQRAVLEGAKNIIRDHLKLEIRKATVSYLGLEKAITPRFRKQGSWRYGTCVQPAWAPPQQLDLDFGVYLPISAWEDHGPPHKIAPLYFKLVEGLLKGLCAQHGWSLRENGNCIRVEVASWGHIDIPLYAVPEKEFEQIMERALAANLLRKSANDSVARMDAAAELEEQEWDDFDAIVLATRLGEWKKSDSEKVSKWFLDRVKEHNEQLQRVCMYLKAWRDFQWKGGGGPTSVSITVAVAQSFECYAGRDDLALEHAARHIDVALRGEIREEGIDDDKEDFNRLPEEKRLEASGKAQALVDALRQARALRAGNENSATEIMIKELGTRLPDKPHLVDVDNGDSVRSTPARTVPPPVVRSTKAG